MEPRLKGEVGWSLVDWTTSAYGPERTESEFDRGTYLSGTSASGSRPVGDHILEHEEHCQEQEDSLPKSSTTQVQVEGELDCSPGRIETSAATWVGTGAKVQQLKPRCIHNTMQKIMMRLRGPQLSNRPCKRRKSRQQPN